MSHDKEVYVLDTNALFNTLKNISDSSTASQESIDKLKAADCYISELSTLEIKSVLGKYARGGQGAAKKMSKKMINQWQKLIKEVTEGSSKIFRVKIIPFDNMILKEAKSVINYTIIHNFGSLDSIIMATTKILISQNGYDNAKLVTSAKGMLAGLYRCGIPSWNAFPEKDHI